MLSNLRVIVLKTYKCAKMSLASLWDPDFATLLQSTPLPGDVLSLLDEVDVENPGNRHGKRKNDDMSAPGPAKKSRFAAPLSEKQIADHCQPSVPKNTQKNTSWGVSVFKDWCSSRNQQSLQKCPEDLLSTPHPTRVIDYWLATFVLEARRQDGNFYPGNTLKNLLAALFRAMKSNLGPLNVTNFIDKTQREAHYPRLNNALDNQLKMLKSCGIGVERNRAAVITVEEENELWRKGILGTHSAKALLNAVFFYNGKNFLLRGVQEHYNLTFAQLKRQDNPDRYTYYEYVSKNHQGGIADCSEGKVVTIVHSNMARSHVAILDLYLSKVPVAAKQPNGKFYRQPLPFTPTGIRPWFFEGHLGQNCIQAMVKNMMQDASIDGKRFTNHSLRATGTTSLFDAGVPEALIQKRSGHRSTKALRMYERVTPDQDLAVSRILHSTSKILYEPITHTQPVVEDFDPDASFSAQDLAICDSIVC